jgi:hypothetical protein
MSTPWFEEELERLVGCNTVHIPITELVALLRELEKLREDVAELEDELVELRGKECGSPSLAGG